VSAANAPERRGAGDAVGTLLFRDVTLGLEVPPLSVEITPTLVVLGAIASRDWRPMHHDYAFAVHRQGVKDIFLNTPNQAAWFERYLTDWTGPHGRLGRMTFRMKSSVFPGDTMILGGTVTTVEIDDAGCGWAGLDLTMRVGDDVKTACSARVAIPTTPDDNPWARRGERWRP
jgi:MaoC like domain